jgi:hypothetical protein
MRHHSILPSLSPVITSKNLSSSLSRLCAIRLTKSAASVTRSLSWMIALGTVQPKWSGNYILAHPDERILLRTNKVNRGLAQNYLDVAFVGKGKYYRLICGDNAEPKETMIAVFREIGQADLIIPYYVTTEGRSLYRRSLSNIYAGLVNLISGFRLHYYNGLAVHLRYNVMRWHPNTRGFGFQADIICMLLNQGYSYKEVPVKTVERRTTGSNALTFRNMLSVAHTLVELIFRRLANRGLSQSIGFYKLAYVILKEGNAKLRL